MATDSIIPKPSQQHILNNFSLMEANNVNSLVNILTMYELYRSISLDTEIDYENGIIPETLSFKSFDLIQSGGVTVDVTPGFCVIKNVLVDVDVTKILNVTDDDFYLGTAEGDGAPTDPGQYVLMVALYYNPNIIRPDAYIGFINDFTYYDNNTDHLIIIGFVTITISGGYVIDDISEGDIGSGLYRRNYGIIDSGTL